jgi:uncharacterized membrane protein YobD (UPF0266 family)
MQKVLIFDSVSPLPILIGKLKKTLLNKLVLVQYGFRFDYYVVGKLEEIEICENGIILVLNIENKRLLVLNPRLLKVI